MNRTFKFGEKREALKGIKKTDRDKQDENEELHVGQEDIKNVSDQIENAGDDDVKKRIIKDNPAITVD